GPFDFVVSNPPYVDRREYEGLQREVRDHEPRIALVPDGGAPVEFYAALAAEARARLREGGWLVVEIGYSMEAAVRECLGSGWTLPPTRTDLQGIPRVVAARK